MEVGRRPGHMVMPHARGGTTRALCGMSVRQYATWLCARFPAWQWFTATVTSVRIFIEEWHFGDEGWDFEVGARIQLPCEPFSTDDLAQVLQVWDAEVVQDVRYSAPVLTVEEAPVVAGVVTRIQA